MTYHSNHLHCGVIIRVLLSTCFYFCWKHNIFSLCAVIYGIVPPSPWVVMLPPSLISLNRGTSLMSVWPCIVDDMERIKPTRCYTMVYWTLWIAQHVSGITMPIIRSSRLYRWSQHMASHLGYGRLLVWCVAVGFWSVRLERCFTTCVASSWFHSLHDTFHVQ